MKPSQRIYQLIGETRSDPEFQERCLEAVIEFLDEQFEKEHKGHTASELRMMEVRDDQG